MNLDFLQQGLSRLYLHRFSPAAETGGYQYYLYIDVETNFVLTVRINNTTGEMLYKNTGSIQATSELAAKWNERASGVYEAIINL